MSGFRVLVIAPPVTPLTSTGPGIRAVALARRLGSSFDTTLSVTGGAAAFAGERFATHVRERRAGGRLPGKYDVIISQGTEYAARSFLRRSGRAPVQVFDLYDPLVFENLEHPRRVGHLGRLTGLLLERADYVLCASARQRDLWLGGVYVSGRLVPADTEERIGVVPFGHDGSAPRATRGVLKAVQPGIETDDRVLLWNGGVWSWLDPATLIRAMARIRSVDRKVKLFFMGGRHPEGIGSDSFRLDEARALAGRLRLLGRSVFFNEGWVRFEERQNYLLESDLAVCTAPEGPENDFSFRARLVDAIWAGLPVVCTRGGGMADFVERHDAGRTVRGGDEDELAARILETLRPEVLGSLRRNVTGCRDELSWERCARPLIAFCERVADGRYVPLREPLWRPWLQYLRYKVPTLVERGAARGPDTDR